jgi:hypothetical protein
MSMSHRPLHGGSADCIRFKQFETLLDKDMKRDAARRHLLRNGGMKESRLDAIGGDDEENGLIRRCVDQLMNAADVAGKSVNSLRIGVGGAISIDGIALDNPNIIRSLTGVTGERAPQHIKRRFRENRDVCIDSIAPDEGMTRDDDDDGYTLHSNLANMSQITDNNNNNNNNNITQHQQQQSPKKLNPAPTIHPVVEDKRKWGMPTFVETSVAPKPAPSTIVQRIIPTIDKGPQPNSSASTVVDAAIDPSTYKKKSLERIQRLAKGIEKLEDPRDALV